MTVFRSEVDILILVIFNCLHYIIKYNSIITQMISFIYNDKVLVKLKMLARIRTKNIK